MITIKDMAELAGVSPTTVSNVLHGRTAKVSPETLKRVKQVIEQSNYVSNMGARLLGRHGSKIIGVVSNYNRRTENNIYSDPFYGSIIGALEGAIREKGYYMMLYTAGSVDEIVRLASSWNIEGVVVLGCNPPDIKRMKQELNMPVVFIDSYYGEEDADYYNVGLSDFDGGYMMTNYLIHQGHTRIAFLADEINPVGVDRERLKGYLKALDENRIPFHEGDYIPISFRKQVRHSQFWENTKAWLDKFTALFFASDFYASDAVNFFQSNGIKVPEQISVVGFDDNILAERCYPMLTTVQQDVSQKGYHAIDLLYRRIQGEDCEEHNLHLPVKLVIRDSVKNNLTEIE